MKLAPGLPIFPIPGMHSYSLWNLTLCVCVCVKSLQSCLTLCNPMDCSPPGSSIHGDSPGKNTGVGCHSLLQGIFPTQGLNPYLLQLLNSYPWNFLLSPKFFVIEKIINKRLISSHCSREYVLLSGAACRSVLDSPQNVKKCCRLSQRHNSFYSGPAMVLINKGNESFKITFRKW